MVIFEMGIFSSSLALSAYCCCVWQIFLTESSLETGFGINFGSNEIDSFSFSVHLSSAFAFLLPI